MRKILAVFAALAVAAGVIVLWQPAAAAGDPVTPAARHPTTRVCPDNGRLLACFAIRQTDTVQPTSPPTCRSRDSDQPICAAPTTSPPPATPR